MAQRNFIGNMPPGFKEEIARRKREADEQMQQAINHIQDIATRACKNSGEGVTTLDSSELHSLRAAATAWAERCARDYRLKSEGDSLERFDDSQSQRDSDDDTARYVMSPF